MYLAFLCNTFITSSVIESENEEDYDSEDILGLKSVQESDGPGWRFSRYICGSSDPEVWHELNNLIGLEPVKRHLHEIIATISVGKGTDMPTLHLMLTENPGVGKTTVARGSSLRAHLEGSVSEIMEFPDYSNTELEDIWEQMVSKDKRYQSEAGLAVKVARMLGKMRGTPEYANAGSVMNAYETAQRNLNARVFRKGIKDR